jgi:acyl carrier protein
VTDQQILDVLTRTLRDILGDESIVLTPQTTRADVPDWDSFQYVTFIVAAELALGIKFGVADVESFANVGEIVAAAQRLVH